MRNISYKRVITNASAAADEITKRAKKKNRIYAATFAILTILVISYIMYALSITTYDGFMVSRNVSIRPSYSLVVVEYKVKPGDRVKEGDTLYTYMNVDWVDKAADPYYEAQSTIRSAEAKLRRDRLISEYSKQQETIDSLYGVIKKANKDVYMGVATKEYAQQLEWDMIIAKKGLENTQRLINIEEREIVNSNYIRGRVNSGSHQIGAYSHNERINNKEVFGHSYNYRVAYVDMVIVDLHARHGVLVMEGEPVVTYMPYNNPEMLDMHTKMLLSPNQFSNVSEGMIFNAYAGDDYLGKVETTYLSTFINNHNVENQDKYERDFKQQDIVVRAEFLDKGCVYKKYMVDKYPLRLTRYRWDWLNNIMDRANSRQRENMISEEKVKDLRERKLYNIH